MVWVGRDNVKYGSSGVADGSGGTTTTSEWQRNAVQKDVVRLAIMGMAIACGVTVAAAGHTSPHDSCEI